MSGFLGSPKLRPKELSSSLIDESNSSISFWGSAPVRKNSRHACVVIVNPGGTGSPILTISAKLAPLPPRRSDCDLSPYEKGKINSATMVIPPTINVGLKSIAQRPDCKQSTNCVLGSCAGNPLEGFARVAVNSRNIMRRGYFLGPQRSSHTHANTTGINVRANFGRLDTTRNNKS